MQGYIPGEQPQDKRYIKLNSNENPYPPSPHVIAALQRAAGEDLRLYPDPLANRLRGTAAAVYGLSREQVLVGNGSDDLLTMLMRTCVGPGISMVRRTSRPLPTLLTRTCVGPGISKDRKSTRLNSSHPSISHAVLRV